MCFMKLPFLPGSKKLIIDHGPFQGLLQQFTLQEYCLFCTLAFIFCTYPYKLSGNLHISDHHHCYSQVLSYYFRRCCIGCYNSPWCANTCYNSLRDNGCRFLGSIFFSHNVESNMIAYFIFIILLAAFRFFITLCSVKRFTLFLKDICTFELDMLKRSHSRYWISLLFFLDSTEFAATLPFWKLLEFAKLLLFIFFVAMLLDLACNPIPFSFLVHLKSL